MAVANECAVLRAALVVGMWACAWVHVSARAAGIRNADSAAPLPGMASLSGTVTAVRPFAAAQVYIRNLDKRILYMVYTRAGSFRAVALFPGHYEINVQARGLEADIRTLTIKSGASPRLKLFLRASRVEDQRPSASADISNPPAAPNEEEFPRALVRNYEEIYPAGAGRAVMEQVCMVCHGEDYPPSRPRSEAAWRQATTGSDRGCLAESLYAPPTAMFRPSSEDRRSVLSYLVQNFGPDKPPRVVRTDPEIPLNEVKLGKAEFIEYYLPLEAEAAGKRNDASNDANSLADHRMAFTLQLDAEGNVWTVDRAAPNRLVRLDPRTGIQKDFVLPDPLGGVHEILIDRDGMIWVPEFMGVPLMREYRLLGFNPKTERWEQQLMADPDHVIQGYREGILGTALDSRGNIYMNWIANGFISRWERSTGKMSFFRVPTPAAAPYGQATDRNDNVWSALYYDGKIAKFDPVRDEWTEFTPLTYPAYIRRGVNVDSRNNVWFGVYAAGNRPGKLDKLDQETGRITEWTIPHRGAQPYEASADWQDNIWFPDKGSPDRLAMLGRFDPRDQTFTFYPKPQFVAESPKLQHTKDGAVWYAPRFGAPAGSSGFGVLYPDMDRIKSLAAYPLNGPPGYAFKVDAAGVESK